MERRIEELEIDLRIANARAELALHLVRYLADELGRSGMVNWGGDDLFRQYLDDADCTEPDVEAARLGIVPTRGEFGEATDQVIAQMKVMASLREKIREQIRHETDPSRPRSG